MGWIRMLRHGSLDSEHTAKALEVIDRNTRVQSSLIEDLLDVSRIISGKMRVEKELTDLSAAVQTAAEAVRPMAAAKNILFDIDTGNEPLFTDGDPVRLQQVASNLLQNAIKFTPEYGSVEVTIKRSGSDAILEFRDSGIGIEDNLLPYIFERFRQGDASTKRGFAGLGLGLTIVRTIVELHGGEIKVDSGGKDRGTLFTVRMPLSEVLYAEEPVSDGDGNGHAKDNALKGIRILLVDDDADSVRPLALFLEDKSASVVTAESAAAALLELKNQQFDVLISDIGMPEKDGFELLTEIRKSASGIDAVPPAIAVTAYASTDDRERALACGFQAHIAKPVNYDKLLAAIKQIRNASFPGTAASGS
jgi:CheY-like chemotaxis protein/two-component sensor histidine kinase